MESNHTSPRGMTCFNLIFAFVAVFGIFGSMIEGLENPWAYLELAWWLLYVLFGWACYKKMLEREKHRHEDGFEQTDLPAREHNDYGFGE